MGMMAQHSNEEKNANTMAVVNVLVAQLWVHGFIPELKSHAQA
jgi:hypothetical protein